MVIRRRQARAETRKAVGSALVRLAVFSALAAAVFTWIFGILLVRGSAMAPTMGDGDVALFSRLPRQLSTGDVIVYELPTGELAAGRVVAQAGDTVEVTEQGELKVNGTVRQPPVSGEATLPTDGGPAYPLALSDGQVFVLGDGRAEATDSRSLGPLGVSEVRGTLLALLRLRGI